MAGAEAPKGRWEQLAGDLVAQAKAWEAAERAGEVAERQRIETGRLRVLDRLRAAEGAALSIRCLGGLQLRGRLARAVSDAIVLAEDGGRETLIALAGVLSISGLGRLSADPDTMSVVESRIGIRQLARAVVRDRSVVRAHVLDGAVYDGTIDRVGADFLELAIHPAGEPRRPAAVRETALIPFGALVAIRRNVG